MELERDPEQTYRCPGCSGTTDSRETMERHEAGCVLALRARIIALETELAELQHGRDEVWAENVGLRFTLRQYADPGNWLDDLPDPEVAYAKVVWSVVEEEGWQAAHDVLERHGPWSADNL